jgi:type I restriction enzyme S subunit
LSEYFQNEVRAISAGGAQANISATQIEDIVIAIPHPSEQEVIVRFDVLLSTEIESKKITLDKVKVLKASLLQDLLTGKVRVKVN